MNRQQRRRLEKNMNDASVPELKAEIRRLKMQLEAIEQEAGDYMIAQKGTDMQQAMDFLAIAAHEEFGFGETRNHRLQKAFNDVFLRYMKISVEDYGFEKRCLTAREMHLGFKPEDNFGDEEMVYTQTVLDRALRAAVGKYYIPFEQRYDMENLYNRDRDILHRKVDEYHRKKEATA